MRVKRSAQGFIRWELMFLVVNRRQTPATRLSGAHLRPCEMHCSRAKKVMLSHRLSYFN
jgi:hypothetical protein